MSRRAPRRVAALVGAAAVALLLLAAPGPAGAQSSGTTDGSGPTTTARMKKLGISDYFAGVSDKLSLLEEKAAAWSVSLDEVAFIGDDLGDLECLSAVAASFCPSDAVARIKAATACICSNPGGEGAVREACDRIYAAKAGE